jgi:hypothetical protein
MTEIIIPENFKSIIVDFTNDLSITFPEYAYLWDRWKTGDENVYKELFEHCLTSFPERFFDILYQNVEIFEPTNETNTVFLPNIDFKLLYNCQGVSENTKKTIWKYLQLLLFTVVGSVKDKSIFGDTANMFDGIDENDLQEKLKDTMEGITNFFENMGVDLDAENKEATDGDSEEQKHEFKFDPKDGMPNIEELHEHLRGLFDGKIGTLAKELAEEISGEFSNILGEDFATNGENTEHTTQDVLKKMMKNPKKMMDLVKTVGDKLKNKMDSGEISKDEIMKEATDILAKMKQMGGGSELNEMLKKFAGGMGGMGKNMRINTSALNQMTKKEEMRQRMRSKLETKRQQMQMSANAANVVIEPGSAPNNYVFRMPGEEQQQRSNVPLTDEELVAAFSSSDNKQSPNEGKTNKKKKNGKKGKK